MTFDPIQLRVLGALIEKEITTPENYPLSLNSLISACNQRSSREPVLDLTEDEVRQAVHSLEDMELVSPVRDARVPKYEHRIRTVLNLRRDETAILCLLLLRGPQTPGELRGRADRMYSFDDIAAVQSTLERMASRSTPGSDGPALPELQSTPLVVQLARLPGSRESRYAHLLGGPVAAAPQKSTSYADASARSFASKDASEDQHLSARIKTLEAALAALEARVDAMEKAKLEASTKETPPA
jgi:uncharacterized protein YceH (UPF0502 family)